MSIVSFSLRQFLRRNSFALLLAVLSLALAAALSAQIVETGIITGIYSYGPAKYEIAIDGDPSAAPPRLSRRIVNFEDVTPIAVEAAP